MFLHLHSKVVLNLKICFERIEISAPSEPLSQRTKILNLDKLVFQRICLMMFKLEIGDVPKPISDLFQTNNNYHSYGTRSSQSLHTPISRSEAIY